MRTFEAARPDDIEHCQRLLAAGSKSFALASKLLPKPVRDRTTVLYAFCRVSDDRVDDDPKASQRTIDAMRDRLDLVYAGRPKDDRVDRALAGLLEDTTIPKALPLALIEGMQWDVEGRRYPTLEDVEAYGARVAASVGAMMTLIMLSSSSGANGTPQERPTTDVLARACDLGVAMQLTNIARDVGEDARRGRFYLPTEWLPDAEAWLRDPRPTVNLRLLVERLLTRADALYRRAEQGIPFLPARCRTAIRGARLIYADIGRSIARAHYDSVSQRAVVSKRRKIWLLGRAAAGGALSGRPDPRLLHEPPLAATRWLVDAGMSVGT